MKKVTVFMAFCVFAMVACPQIVEAQSENEPQEFYSLEMYYAPSQYIYNGSDLTVKDEEPFKQTGLGISINKPLSKFLHHLDDSVTMHLQSLRKIVRESFIGAFSFHNSLCSFIQSATDLYIRLGWRLLFIHQFSFG